MGCDIHMFCEEKSIRNGGEVWINADHWVINPHYGVFDNEEEYQVVELYGDRNYSVFAALCGVRDYTGNSPKISEPRGLPLNCSEQVKRGSDRWRLDGHSHSYVTLREVRDFVKKDEPVLLSGLITKDQAEALESEGKTPDSWCQASSRNDLVFREWSEKLRPLEGLYKAMCERFAPYSKPDEISEDKLDNFRIVFWFDN